MIVVIDTCVIIDVILDRKPFCDDAKNIFLLAAGNKINAYITANSISDIYYICNKNIHNEAATKEIIDRLISIFKIADTTALDCRKAIFNDVKDFEDAILIETATRIGAECIVTRNSKDYFCSKIPSYSPKEFLQILNIDTGAIM